MADDSLGSRLIGVHKETIFQEVITWARCFLVFFFGLIRKLSSEAIRLLQGAYSQLSPQLRQLVLCIKCWAKAEADPWPLRKGLKNRWNSAESVIAQPSVFVILDAGRNLLLKKETLKRPLQKEQIDLNHPLAGYLF